MTPDSSTASPPGPRVSIGMPVFNSERLIDPTIEALLAQTFTDFELVILDNASADRTEEICRRFAATDARVRYLRNDHNIGANRNYVAVFAHARAPYFKWASSNDLCAPTFIASCVEALERDPAAVLAYPRTNLFVHNVADATPYDDDFAVEDESSSARFARIGRQMRLNNAMNGVIRAAALRSAVPLGSFVGADIVLMRELALLGKYLLVPERLFFRRMSQESATRFWTQKEKERHFEPQANQPLLWQNWKYCLRLLRVAARSGQGIAERGRALVDALRYLLWARKRLARDVAQAAGRLA